MSSADAPAPAAANNHDKHQSPDKEFAPMGDHEQKQAAELIQRNYRGYRSRRQLQGMGLDPSARWAEVRLLHVHNSSCILRLTYSPCTGYQRGSVLYIRTHTNLILNLQSEMEEYHTTQIPRRSAILGKPPIVPRTTCARYI
jgi:hypothetical protein